MALPTARGALNALSHSRSSANAIASSSRYIRTSAPSSASAPPSRNLPTTSSSAETDSLPVPLQSIQKFLSFPAVKPLTPTHGVKVATLHLQSYHPYNLDLYSQFCVHSAHSLGIPTSLPAFLPREKSLYTVLKSPFVKKKAQENFERKTYKRAITIYDAHRESVDLFLRYVRQNGLPGVGMKAYVHEWVEYGFANKEGKGAVGSGDPAAIDEKRIQDAAEDLVKALSEGEEVKAIAGKTQEAGGAVSSPTADVTQAQAKKSDGVEVKAEKSEA